VTPFRLAPTDEVFATQGADIHFWQNFLLKQIDYIVAAEIRKILSSDRIPVGGAAVNPHSIDGVGAEAEVVNSGSPLGGEEFVIHRFGLPKFRTVVIHCGMLCL
jgi:hypothetical protein